MAANNGESAGVRTSVASQFFNEDEDTAIVDMTTSEKVSPNNPWNDLVHI